jgi:hypothetical protein
MAIMMQSHLLPLQLPSLLEAKCETVTLTLPSPEKFLIQWQMVQRSPTSHTQQYVVFLQDTPFMDCGE